MLFGDEKFCFVLFLVFFFFLFFLCFVFLKVWFGGEKFCFVFLFSCFLFSFFFFLKPVYTKCVTFNYTFGYKIPHTDPIALLRKFNGGKITTCTG